MSATTKIAVGVASGYLLGRTRKLRLAVTVAGLLAGQRLAADRGTLLQQGSKLLDSSPELKQLRDQIAGRLMETARDAALGVASSRVERFTKSLQAAPQDDADDEVDEADDAQDDAQDDTQDTGDEIYDDPDESADDTDGEADERPAKRAGRKTATSTATKTGKKAATSTARRTPAKKASSRSRRGRTSQDARG